MTIHSMILSDLHDGPDPEAEKYLDRHEKWPWYTLKDGLELTDELEDSLEKLGYVYLGSPEDGFIYHEPCDERSELHRQIYGPRDQEPTNAVKVMNEVVEDVAEKGNRLEVSASELVVELRSSNDSEYIRFRMAGHEEIEVSTGGDLLCCGVYFDLTETHLRLLKLAVDLMLEELQRKRD